MGFVTLKCPNCGATMELDDTREIGFCQYCGTKIFQDKQIIEHRGSVALDRSQEINNLLVRAMEMQNAGDIEKAVDYYNRVLDIDSNNQIAKKAVKAFTKKYNFFLQAVAGKLYSKKAKVSIKIDKIDHGWIFMGEQRKFELSTGVHNVELKIYQTLHKYKFKIEIIDESTVINYLITCKFGNAIDITQR